MPWPISCLGDIASSQGQPGLVADQLRDWALGPYIQDQWKVTRKLTINMGLRYELQPGLSEKYDHMTNINWAWNNSFEPTWVRAGSGDFYAGNPPFPLPAGVPYARGPNGDTTWKTAKTQFGPRAGFAYNIDPKTVIRAGFGIYYPHDVGQHGVRRNAQSALYGPHREQLEHVGSERNWSSPFPVIAISTHGPGLGLGRSAALTPQWTFNVQRSLSANSTTLEVGYEGSAGIHLQRTVYYNDSPPAAPDK